MADPGDDPPDLPVGQGKIGDSEQSHSTQRADSNKAWNVDRPTEPDSLDSLWIRWTDGGSDLHLHRICEVVPQVTVSTSWPFFHPIPEGDSPPNYERVPANPDENKTDQVQFRFITGVPRQLLRHLPLVILLASIAIFGGPELIPAVDVYGLSKFAPVSGGGNAFLFGIFLLLMPVLIWLLGSAGLIEAREVTNAGVVYGLIGFLGLCVTVSVYLVTTAGHPSQIDPNVVLTSGYLLTLLVGGMLLYEAILRLEHLLVNLGDRQNGIIDDKKEYSRFLTDLDTVLNQKRIFGFVHPSRLFGVLFSAQFLIIWTLGAGPQNLDYSIGLVVNFLLNAVLVTVVFKFFILVTYLNKLFNEKKEYRDVGLHYEPFHVDGYGGFRDFGRFATRINLILTVAGLYVVFRLYVIGGRVFPMEGFAGFTEPLVFTVWFFSFLGPLMAYGVGAAAWGYYSFWSMHMKMKRDKQMFARRFQGSRGNVDVDRTPSAGDSIDDFDDCNGPEWGAFRAAPTWPLDVNRMWSLLSGNMIPLLLPLLNLFV